MKSNERFNNQNNQMFHFQTISMISYLISIFDFTSDCNAFKKNTHFIYSLTHFPIALLLISRICIALNPPEASTQRANIAAKGRTYFHGFPIPTCTGCAAGHTVLYITGKQKRWSRLRVSVLRTHSSTHFTPQCSKSLRTRNSSETFCAISVACLYSLSAHSMFRVAMSEIT